MKLIVFVYDFPHRKSCEGIDQLVKHGYRPTRIIAQERKVLAHTPSRPIPSIEWSKHPEEVAAENGIPYYKTDHDSTVALHLMNDADLGIVLGARILPQKVIDKFRIGILNLHPGILPHNRGLDNIKWAILDNIPQGVTAHLIDRNVDKGELISWFIMPFGDQSTLTEIAECLYKIQIHILPHAVKLALDGKGWVEQPGKWGPNRGVVTEEEDDIVDEIIEGGLNDQ